MRVSLKTLIAGAALSVLAMAGAAQAAWPERAERSAANPIATAFSPSAIVTSTVAPSRIARRNPRCWK